jgi:hypothetical protein
MTVMNEMFRTAFEIGRSGQGKTMADNYLLEVIQQFASDKRLDAFFADLNIAMSDVGDSLTDAAKLRIAAQETGDLISRLVKVQQSLTERATSIIAQRQEAGIMQEGFFEIYPRTKHENRKPDVERIKLDYPAKWDLLLNLKIEDVKTSYTPNQSELKTVFGKYLWETMLIPAQEIIIGYDIKPILSEGEKP